MKVNFLCDQSIGEQFISSSFNELIKRTGLKIKKEKAFGAFNGCDGCEVIFPNQEINIETLDDLVELAGYFYYTEAIVLSSKKDGTLDLILTRRPLKFEDLLSRCEGQQSEEDGVMCFVPKSFLNKRQLKILEKGERINKEIIKAIEE